MKRLGLILASVALLCGAVQDGVAGKVARSGAVHRVDAVGAVLVHTVQAPDGSETVTEIPDTVDAAPDLQPVIDIDPIADQPVLVWSRDEGQGFDLFISRFDGRSWSAMESFAATPADDVDPQIRVRPDLVHVVWSGSLPGGDVQFMRQSLWRKNLGAAYGPEMLDVPDGESGLVPPDGQDDPGPAPARDDTFFTVELPPRESRGARVVVWGIRDEPVPIGYRQGLLTPQDLHEASMSSSGWIGDTFAIWFLADEHLHYQLRQKTGWSELRTIRLSADTSAIQAVDALHEMLTRAGSGGDGD